MPDLPQAPPAADTLRAEMLHAAADALARAAPGLPPAAARFIARLHAAVPIAELAALPP